MANHNLPPEEGQPGTAEATSPAKAHATPEPLPDAARPRIWVGSWLDYNNGRLHGEWIDADREADDIWTDINRMLASSPTARESTWGEMAEEWGIFDYENFGLHRVSEQADVGRLSRIGRGIAQHGPAFAAWADLADDDELDNFDDAYLGAYDSLEAYAEQLTDDLGYEELLDNALPAHLRPYVHLDVAALTHDLESDGAVTTISRPDGGVWIFDTR